MISNLPTMAVRKVTVEIDTALADQQISFITDILQQDYHLTRSERMALDGVRNLLAAMLGTEIEQPRAPAKRIKHEDVNRIRDLGAAGKTPAAIAKQFGYRPLAVSRLLLGRTYQDVAYEPSEFALKTERNR